MENYLSESLWLIISHFLKDYKPKQLPWGYIQVHKLVHLTTEWMCTFLHIHMVFLAVSPGHGIWPWFLGSTLALYFRNKLWKEAFFGFLCITVPKESIVPWVSNLVPDHNLVRGGSVSWWVMLTFPPRKGTFWNELQHLRSEWEC